MGTGAPVQSAVLLTHVPRAQHPRQGITSGYLPAYNQQQMHTHCSRHPRLSCGCSWQVEEAVSSYHRLQVATSLEGSENKLGLQGPRRAAIAQLAAVLKLRIQVIISADSLLLQHHAWHTSMLYPPSSWQQ
jgi:hypothetical protein